MRAQLELGNDVARPMIPGPELDLRSLNQTLATTPPPVPGRDAGPERRTCLVR